MNEPITPAKDLNEFAKLCTGEPRWMAFRAQVTRCSERDAKGGKKYYEAEFADATGALKLKCWSGKPAWDFCAAQAMMQGDPKAERPVVEVRGMFSRGDYGVESNDWRPMDLTQEQCDAFFLGSDDVRAKQADDWYYICAFILGMNDRNFHQLGMAFIGRYEIEFKRAAAARGNHHARPGGLVEHVAEMMRVAEGICDAYPELNRDLLLTAVLFHDCGKMWENQYRVNSFEMPHSAPAEMLGHIAIGYDLARNLWQECEREDLRRGGDAWPADKLLHLRHLILSHHGELEWGSPVTPRTMEAIVLHYVDQIGAKIEMFRGALRKSREIAPGVLEKTFPLPGNLVRTPAWDTGSPAEASAPAKAEKGAE